MEGRAQYGALEGVGGTDVPQDRYQTGFRAIPVKSQVRDLIRDDSRLEVGATIESLLAETGQELPDNLGEGETAAPETQAGA